MDDGDDGDEAAAVSADDLALPRDGGDVAGGECGSRRSLGDDRSASPESGSPAAVLRRSVRGRGRFFMLWYQCLL